jgi:hypothetical protein
MKRQVYIIFEADTPQDIMDQWVTQYGASIYWTNPSPSHLALAAEEGWTFPHVLEEFIPE